MRTKNYETTVTVRDNNTDQQVTTMLDGIAEAIRPWFLEAPADVHETIDELQAKIDRGDNTDAEVVYLDISIEFRGRTGGLAMTTIPVTRGYGPTVDLTSGDQIIRITDDTAEWLEYDDHRGWVVEQGGQFAGCLTDQQVEDLAAADVIKGVLQAPSGHDGSEVCEVR